MKLFNPAESLQLHKPDDNMRDIKYSHSLPLLNRDSDIKVWKWVIVEYVVQEQTLTKRKRLLGKLMFSKSQDGNSMYSTEIKISATNKRTRLKSFHKYRDCNRTIYAANSFARLGFSTFH